MAGAAAADTAPSRFAALVEQGAAVWAVNPGGASLDVVDALARAGARCLFIDCERTAVHIESVSALVRCAHSHGMAALLRTESAAPAILVRYLDRGIDGIVVPHTETVAELDAIAEVVRYVTRGRPERVFAIAQIESQPAVANVAALAACRSVDGFLIGPNDLSHSLGLAGDTARPEVAAAVDTVVAALQRQGRVWGLPAQCDTAARWARRGARFLYGTLDQILSAGYAPMAQAVTAPTHPPAMRTSP
jgi:4-hydroxy-2-oxoheptanedioate aldolase